ncbi:hypothetical protein K432DRAFT_390669 [Lepidopterella palustris CBS 459.81]|uniref:Uncharacterized protein n=1 Tax=Lepidopterella palustris CBS 459.81 TaxID=1314670 RepID=A0A8E2EFN1_9PEZI|nr:hypothetical protein K432DRAFT_390669 [Lepidopterella palustris CBS 459.81]
MKTTALTSISLIPTSILPFYGFAYHCGGHKIVEIDRILQDIRRKSDCVIHSLFQANILIWQRNQCVRHAHANANASSFAKPEIQLRYVSERPSGPLVDLLTLYVLLLSTPTPAQIKSRRCHCLWYMACHCRAGLQRLRMLHIWVPIGATNTELPGQSSTLGLSLSATRARAWRPLKLLALMPNDGVGLEQSTLIKSFGDDPKLRRYAD